MAKKRWRALRPVTVNYEPGEEFEREYSEEKEELLVERGILEEVKPAPVKRSPAKELKGGGDGSS